MNKSGQQGMGLWAGQFLALTMCYVLLEWISSLHEFKGLPFIAWDPGLGLLFCALILRPQIAAPALFSGIICAEALFLASTADLLRVLVFALIITGTYALTARFIMRLDAGFDASLSRMRDVAWLLAGGTIGAFCSAALLVVFLLLSGELAPSDIARAGWPHVVGDVIGIGTVTPLCLKLYAARGRLNLTALAKAWPEILAFAVAIITFGSVARVSESEALQFFYILFIPTMLAAARFGLFGATLMLSATELALVIWLEWVDADPSRFTAYQTLMLLLGLTGLLVGTLISERDAARLKAAALEAEATRAARFNLVSGMASALLHDLSQPLTAARARARTVQLLSDAGDLTRLKENLGPLLTQIDRASTILHGMRDFMGRGTSSRQPYDWASITATVDLLLAPVAEERGVKLILNRPTLPLILCERTQIEQVLINLIGNALDALRHGEGEKWVQVDARQDDTRVQISIIDNGPGIDPQIAPRLFEALVTSKPDGLGLGMVICKSIIEAHEGRLWLESSKPGLTEFRFTLPCLMEMRS
jgi:two-component system, LuxR family, sensor kinase FixL